jgi:hypothetical protein
VIICIHEDATIYFLARVRLACVWLSTLCARCCMCVATEVCAALAQQDPVFSIEERPS